MLISAPNLGEAAKDPDLMRQVLDQFFQDLCRRLAAESPAGIVTAWPGAMDIPEGWIECDGETYDQSKFPELYRAIGDAFGGTGTTFDVPPDGPVAAGPDWRWIIRVGT